MKYKTTPNSIKKYNFQLGKTWYEIVNIIAESILLCDRYANEKTKSSAAVDIEGCNANTIFLD